MKAWDEVEVFVHEGVGEPIRVGSLRPSFTVSRILAACSFDYDLSYLARRDRYEISPDLPLIPGRVYTAENQAMFGAFADSSPDEWGRKIIEANHLLRTKADPTLPRRIGDFDILLGVSDFSRMGALRFKSPGSTEWLSGDPGVANLHELPRILAAARRYEMAEATDEDVEFLAGVATSPGGARPKASVLTDGDQLAIAKLPHSKDQEVDAEAWEAVALTIVGNAGLRTSPFTLHRVAEGGSVLVVHRFDRDPEGGRRGYMSAATALGIGEHDVGRRITYEEFADTISDLSDTPSLDLREMFGRIAVTVFINNVDDHWRNHGFLRKGNSWQLAPLFDVNPSARHGVIVSRAINDQDDPRNRDVRNLLAIADAYGLTRQRAVSILRSVAYEVEKWPEVANSLGISAVQQSVMSRAFDTAQLQRVKAMP